MYKFNTKAEPFARGFLSCESGDLTKKTASGHLLRAKEMGLQIDRDNGLATPFPGGAVFSPYYGMTINEGAFDQMAKDDPDNANDYFYMKDVMREYEPIRKIFKAFTKQQRDLWDTTTACGATWCGHAVPNFVNIAKYGTDSMRERINSYRDVNPGSAEFYDGLCIIMDAVDTLGERYRNQALDEAEKAEGKQKEKLLRLARAFEKAPKAPCTDFIEAATVYVMLFSFDGVDSPGHFDWYMYEFWKNTPHDEAREMLEDVWQYFHYTRTWNVCISGSDENWNDITNELTYEILEVCGKYKYQTPNLTMRVHRNTPKELIRAAAKCVGTGTGMPTFYNDEAVCPALERLGIPPCDSHLYVMNGCNQIDIQGKSHMGLEDGDVNMGKAVELVFSRGICRKTGKVLGPDTGAIDKMDTFEKFYEAFLTQLDHITGSMCDMANTAHHIYSTVVSNPLRAATIEGCIEKGRDYKNQGPLYGHGQVLAEGVADAIDSVCAVKKFVYDDKLFTLDELDSALINDFEGYDEIYSIIKKSNLHFGNDIEYVDVIGKDIVDHFNNYLLTRKTARGGIYGGGCSPFVRAAQNGGAVAALPNGKKSTEKLYADSIGATPGFDIEGPTALLKSCLVFDHTLPTSGFILNIKFDKAIYNTPAGIEAFEALFHAYFDGKGQQLSVTVVSAEELIDAKAHPENHRDLIVRVGGYSDYFVNLGADLQDNIIARTQYKL